MATIDRFPTFATITTGQDYPVENYRQVAILPAASSSITITNANGDTIIVTSPIIFGDKQNDSWKTLKVTATSGTATLVINGDVAIPSTSSGGGGGGGDASAANQVLEIAQLTAINANTFSALPYGADYFIQSNPDTNGNYQTVVYKTGGAGGTTVKTVTLTFDATGNVLTYTAV